MSGFTLLSFAASCILFSLLVTRRNCCEALIVLVAYCTLPICITGGEIYYDPVQRLEPVGALSLSKEQFSSRRYNMFKDFTIYTKLYLKKKTESYSYYVLELSACVINSLFLAPLNRLFTI